MQNENNDPSGREQRTTLLLNAPLETVWNVWTKPEHIKDWWGPNGFTITIKKMEVKTGGDWICRLPQKQYGLKIDEEVLIFKRKT